jgi:hypothetical protein
MTYRELIRALVSGFAQDLPYVGGLFRAYAAAVAEKRGQEVRLQEKQEFLKEIGTRIEQVLGREQRKEAELVLEEISLEGRSALTSTNIQIQAAAVSRLDVAPAAFQNRFLYLAAGNYASSARTAEIAGQYGFLWRSYHADRIPIQGINKANRLKSGDLIVLAYREPRRFFILTPLIIIDPAAGNLTIEDTDYDCGKRNNPHIHAPFVLAVPPLDGILKAEGYDPDSVFRRQCGLNVRTLLSDVTEVKTKGILQGTFDSPGRDAIWPHDDPKVPAQVTRWIASL